MRVGGAVTVNAYEVVARAVEEGSRMGVTRAYKHTDTPDPDAIAASVEREVMNALCEVLEFGDSRA